MWNPAGDCDETQSQRDPRVRERADRVERGTAQVRHDIVVTRGLDAGEDGGAVNDLFRPDIDRHTGRRLNRVEDGATRPPRTDEVVQVQRTETNDIHGHACLDHRRERSKQTAQPGFDVAPGNCLYGRRRRWWYMSLSRLDFGSAPVT